jgi:hypothetical protein
MKHILALALLVALMGNALGCGSNSSDLTPQQACNGRTESRLGIAHRE